MVTPPLVITVFDRNFVRTGIVGAPLSAEFHPRHGAQPTGSFTVAADNPYVPQLRANGARVTVDYDGQQIMCGPLRRRTGTSGVEATYTFEVEDDWRILGRILAWSKPTAAITAQGQDTSQDSKTGPAEDVAKWFIRRNATRLGLPVTVAADAHRGSTITVSTRFDVPADKLIPLITDAGVGVRVKQVDAGLVVDCYAPTLYPRDLTVESGAIESYEWEVNAPTATRVVVGGGRSGANRDFYAFVDAALEADWGDVVEVFVDASDAISDLQAAFDAYTDAVKTRSDALVELNSTRRAETTRLRARDHATRTYSVASKIAARNPTDTEDQDTKTQAAADLTQATQDLNQATAERVSANNAYNAAVTDAANKLQAYTDQQPLYALEINRRAADALASGGPTVGLTMTLAETETFRYGRSVRVGDLVRTVGLVPGQGAITNAITEAVLTWDADSGLTAVPIAGERFTPEKVQAAAVARIAKRLRILVAGR